MDKKNQVKKIFDSIAYRYDFLNHLLSIGFDIYWRKKALELTKINEDARLLDIACGTGDFAIAARKLGTKNLIGADFSRPMLRLFSGKAGWIIGKLVQTTAEYPPFQTSTFTNIIVAFGVRNFYDIFKAFNSFNQILKENGKLTILEFRLPKNPIFRQIYKFYFNKILPLIGSIISKDKTAYNYLPESVYEFDEKVQLETILKKTNFSRVEIYSLTFGIVQVVIATK
jgi:demethylmenaquinone methyltransferase / 2-methoxy-6-polyprenyl-1,4-benzoquinol methylase